jgi:hypothetical protein
MAKVGLVVWLDKHVRDQPWSSLELSEFIISDSSRIDEIVECFEDGKIDTRYMAAIDILFVFVFSLIRCHLLFECFSFH